MLDPYSTYLTERVAAFADLSGRRLLREIMKLGHEGSYLALKPFLREVIPTALIIDLYPISFGD